MAPSFEGPGLLALPLELRLDIYDYILTSTNERWSKFETYDGSRGYYISHSAPPTHRYKYRGHFGLLSVCHQIRNDVMPLLLGYPHAFDCLQDLCDWIERAPAVLLPLIKKVHVRVAARSLRWMGTSQRRALPLVSREADEDVTGWIAKHRQLLEDEYDLPPERRFGNRSRPSAAVQVMDPWLGPLYDLVRGPLFGAPTSDVESPRENVIAQLWRTFQRLSHVASLRVVMGGSNPNADMTHAADQQLLVLMLAAAMPSLRHLSIVSVPLAWDYFTRYASLRHLELSGFGPGLPSHAVAALNALRCLEAVTLRWGRASHDTSQLPGNPQNNFLFGGRVLESLRPLSRFDLVCDDRALSPTYFDPALLGALREGHAASLREFRIDSRPAPDSFGGAMVSAEAFAAVLELLRASRRVARLTLRLELEPGWTAEEHDGKLEGVLPDSLEHRSVFVKAPPVDREGRHELLRIT